MRTTRLLLALGGVVTTLGGAARPLRAQDAGCAAAPSYDRCALRFEEPHIVVGQRGDRIARVGLFSVPDLRPRVQGSDSAAAYARRFRARQLASNTGLWASLGLSIGAGVVGAPAARRDDRMPPVVAAMLGASVGSLVYAIYEQHRARAALARTMWWYNRDLPR